MSADRGPYHVFVEDSVSDPTGLPYQLFVQKDFDFLLTGGVGLFGDEEECRAFLSLLHELGEAQFYLQEHSTQLNKTIPFKRRFSVLTSFQEFNQEVSKYSEFGLLPASWYVYGDSQDWGIYLAELPTINVIGCRPQFINKFRQIFNISDLGYDELKDFIRKEFQCIQSRYPEQDLLNQFETNYKLKASGRM